MNPIDELLALCESSLDDRPEFRKALANANRYHNHASVVQCQQKSVLLRDRLEEFDDDDTLPSKARLFIGEAAKFADDTQSYIESAMNSIKEGV